MDLDIRPVTPEIQRQRGADAFDRGEPIDGHNMNPGRPAIVDWMRGWRLREIEQRAAARTELVRQVARQQLAGSPP